MNADIKILEATQIPSEIVRFLQENERTPDFYCLFKETVYFVHCHEKGQCFLDMFRISDGVLWVGFPGNTPAKSVEKAFSRVSELVHVEVCE